MPTIALVLLGCLALGGEPSASSPTRLYVRTAPPGAKSRWKGNRWASPTRSSPSRPAPKRVLVELDGYLPEERRVEIRAEEITRVELQLKRRPETAGQTGTPASPNAGKVDAEKKDDAASKAANAYLADADLPVAGSRRDAHSPSPAPDGDSLVGTGRYDHVRHRRKAIARADRFGSKPCRPMLNLTGMLAFQELLKAKSASGPLRSRWLDRRDHVAAGCHGSGRRRFRSRGKPAPSSRVQQSAETTP